MKRTCENCKWHDDWTWACFNGESDRRADFTDNESSCEKWEEKHEQGD